MPAKRGRRFGLFDALILGAAAILGAVSLRSFLDDGRERLEYHRRLFAEDAATLYPIVGIGLVEPVLIALTVAFLFIRLRRDRPSMVRLARQPGLAASLAVSMVIVARGLLAALDMAIMGIPPRDAFQAQFYPSIVGLPGGAVAATWILMAVARRWRSEPGWIDRMGRVLGACWIAVFLVGSWGTFWFTSLKIRHRPTPVQEALWQQQEAAADAQMMRDMEEQENRLKELERENEELQKLLDQQKSRGKPDQNLNP